MEKGSDIFVVWEREEASTYKRTVYMSETEKKAIIRDAVEAVDRVKGMSEETE